MALTVTDGSPIKVTGTTAADEAIVAFTGALVFIKFIYWFNPTAIGHLCTLTGSVGEPLIEMRCEVANESQMWPVWTPKSGIRCTDMDSGTLYIYRR